MDNLKIHYVVFTGFEGDEKLQLKFILAAIILKYL